MSDPIEMLRSATVSDHIVALETLIKEKRDDAVAAVAPLLSSPDAVVRELGARYLGLFAVRGDVAVRGDTHTAEQLLRVLDDPDALVRGQVATSLGLLHYPPAVAQLQRMVRADPAWSARVAAIESLAKIDGATSFATFAQALESDPSALAQRYAADAIRVTARAEHLEAISRLAHAQRGEPINAIHLFIATYKLGRQDDFAEICRLLDAENDVEDAQYIIHVLESAYIGHLPPYMLTDIPTLLRSLDALAERLPDTAAYCAELKEQLANIQQGDLYLIPSAETPSPRPHWGPRHGEMMEQVMPLWRGPISLFMPERPGEDSFWGWNVLKLAVRYDYPMRLESRIAYGHLFTSEQPMAILRSVSWDDKAVRKVIWAEGQNAPLSVPARFVALPMSQLRQWLAAFEDITTHAEQTIIDDTELPIRQVRVEWNYTSCVFEKVWQSPDPQHAPLVAAWTRVWTDMSEALDALPQLDPQELEEEYEVTPQSGLYDTKSYDTHWLRLS